MTLPAEFREKMINLFGYSEYELFEKSLTERCFTGLRVNSLKTTSNELFKLIGANLAGIDWCSDGFYYDSSESRLSKSPYYHAGLFYLQEPSAMLPVSVLPISENDIVLDLCASPGGKSTQIATKLKGTGAIVSNDLSPNRISPLISNIEQFGITNCVVTNESVQRLSEYFGAFFDKILIDAPCSGEGMFRKDKDSISAWDKNKPERLSAIQKVLLEYSAKMLKEGGLMAYSTCTFSPEENEQQIRLFLQENPNFEIYKINYSDYNVSQARVEWSEMDSRLSHAVRIFPHLQLGEGHFTAILIKTGKNAENAYSIENNIKNKKNSIKKNFSIKNHEKIKGIEYFTDFCNNYTNFKPDIDSIKMHRDVIYIPPACLPDMKALRISRGGYYLGRLKDKRFEPSGAFALGLKKEQYGQSINFDIGSDQLRRFIIGESFDVNKPNGFYTVCVDGFAIDMAKITGERLKWRARG